MHLSHENCIVWKHSVTFSLHAFVARERYRVDTRRIFILHASVARELHRVDTRRVGVTFRLHASAARELHRVETQRDL